MSNTNETTTMQQAKEQASEDAQMQSSQETAMTVQAVEDVKESIVKTLTQEKSEATEHVEESKDGVTALKTNASKTTENMPSNGAILTSDFEQVQQMYQAQNLTRGIAPVQVSADGAPAKKIGPRTIFIPAAIFSEFTEVNTDNEDFFSYISFYVVIQMLEKVTDLNWVVQFPFNIPSGGRSVIHDVATHFGLTSHSQGTKKRTALVYPRTQFKDKQEAEISKKQKEFKKLREKTKTIILNENPKTIRDKMIALIAEEQKKTPSQARIDKLHGEIFFSIEHVPVEFEEYKAWVQPVIEAKQKELALSVFAAKTPVPVLGELKTDENQDEEEKKEDATPAATQDQSTASQKPADTEMQAQDTPAATKEKKDEPKVKMGAEDIVMSGQETKPKATAAEGADDADEDGSADEEEMSHEPTQEEIEAALKYKMTKEHEAAKIKSYHQKVLQTNAAEFRDKPDPIQFIRVIQSFADSLVIEWDKPCDNNEEIVLYNIYVAESKEISELDQLYQTEAKVDQLYASYKIPDLEPNTIYYLRVFAVNAIGEGYKPDQPVFARTMEDTLHEPGSLYVWGNNLSSELGLTDEQVEENKQSYKKSSMRAPIQHQQFNGIVYDVAAGNVNTMFHCVNNETKDTFVVMCGMTIAVKDGQEIDKNELVHEDVQMLEEVPSIPYMIDFNIPVVKIACGDMFAGILTAEGFVYTWGHNSYGQLGLKNEKTLLVQRPNRIDFIDHHSDSSGRPMFVKDLCLGYNHGLALTDNNQVFVWGRRMGIYPNIELSYNYLTANAHLQNIEIHQSEPRLLSNNLIFYKITKLCAGPWNSAFLTDKNQVLIQGENEFGQLGLGAQIGPFCKFFPNFVKLDFFEEQKLDVIDVTFTGGSSHFLCQERDSEHRRLFSIGNNDFGQLGSNNALSTHTPVEITDKFPEGEEVIQIASGGFHTLALTSTNKLYAWGKLTKGQFAKQWTKGQPKFANGPTEIQLPADIELSKVYGGSLFTMLEITTPQEPSEETPQPPLEQEALVQEDRAAQQQQV